MMSKVILTGFIEVADSDLAMVKAELVAHIELSRKEPGCIIFTVEQDYLNNHRFNVYEEFESEKAFKAHQARVSASSWGMATKHLKRNYHISGLR